MQGSEYTFTTCLHRGGCAAGESANGDFSAIAVATMAAIVANAEVGVDYYSQHSFIRWVASRQA